MSKILFIDNTKIFEKWASKTYEYKINEIKKNDSFEFVDIDDIENNEYLEKDYIMVVFGWNATYISKFYTFKYNYYTKYIKNLDHKEMMEKKLQPFLEWERKYLVIQDLADYDYEGGLPNFCNYILKHNINGVITPYHKTETMKYVLTRVPKLRIVHIEHHINSNYFKDYNFKKKYDIFLFGTINTHYPFRQRLKSLLLKNKDKFTILFWDKFRNYFRFEKHKSNDALSKIMNRSWLTICTRAKYDMLLGKYFEASMSKSIVCGNMPTDGVNIWDDNYIHLDYTMSDDEIISIIQKALQYKSKLLNNANIMLNKMEDYHLSKFAQKLYFKLQMELI